MPYSEYKYMEVHGLESDRRKLEAYLRYCDVEQVKEMCQRRINAIVAELATRSEKELYNLNLPTWKN